MGAQLHVFQHHLHHFHGCIKQQAEQEKLLRQRLHAVLNDAGYVSVCVFVCMLCMHVSVHVIESSWRNGHAIMSACKWDVQSLRIVFGSRDCVSANCVSCRA
jgi:hypothetical protein